jgi:hypothetical protein
MPRNRNHQFLEGLRRKQEELRAAANKPERKPLGEMSLEELEDEERRVRRGLLEHQLQQDLARLNKDTADKQRRPSLAPILGRKARRYWK